MNTDTIADIVTFWLGDSRDHPDRALAATTGGTGEVRRSTKRSAPASVIWSRAPAPASSWAGGSRRTARWPWVLLLDQFTRNLYRGTAGAYAGDPCAFEIVNHAIDRGLDRALHRSRGSGSITRSTTARTSRNRTAASGSCGLCGRTPIRAGTPTWNEASRAGTATATSSPASGRFPHRNAVLGRESTTEELSHLAADGESFGQGCPPLVEAALANRSQGGYRAGHLPA